MKPPEPSSLAQKQRSLPEWVADAVFYQIFVDRFANGDRSTDLPGNVAWSSAPTRDNTFGGDLQGILDHLPYLQDLGVNALYLTPVFRARSNHKYDTCDYLQVDPAFGSEGLLRRLVSAAHEHGIRIILDAVFNHCGEGFWAFEDVKRNGASSPHAHWFFVDSFPVRTDPPNYQTCGASVYLPKLNVLNPETRDYLLGVATYWIEQCDIDGWRLDVPWKVPLEFWRLFRERVKQAKPEAYIVGEIWRDPGPWLQGDTCDGVMNYPLREAILDFCVRETMDAEDIDYEMRHGQSVQGRSAPYQLNLLGSHDTPRLLTLCSGDLDRAILSATLLFASVGAPMIYYGDELGVTGGNDPDCRKPMPWSEASQERKLFHTFRRLVSARRQHPALRRGSFETVWLRNAVYAFRRRHGQDEILVVLNPRHAVPDLDVPLDQGSAGRRIWHDVLTDEQFVEDQGVLHLGLLPAKKAYLLSTDELARAARAR